MALTIIPSVVAVPLHLVHILEVILGTVFFSLLFCVSVKFLQGYKNKPICNTRCLTDNDCYDISIKVATFVFSVLSWLFAAITVYHLNNMDIMEDKFWLLNAWVYFSSGYYLYDTVMKPYCYGLDRNLKGGLTIFVGFFRSQPLMMLHHIITLLFFYPTLMWFRNGKGDFIVACFFLMDFSVPFIQIRHVMYRLGLSEMPLYLWNGIVLVVTFFLSRIVLLFYIYKRYADYRGVPLFQGVGLLPKPCNIGMLSMLIMQGYWFGMMIKKLAKYLRSHGKAE